MNKELFNTIYAAMQSVPFDKWKNEHSGRRYYGDYIIADKIVIYDDGELRIKGITQSIGYFQKRKLYKLYQKVESELAARYVQRTLDKA